MPIAIPADPGKTGCSRGTATVIRVTHIITGLDRGGAESALQKLVLNTDVTRFRSSVVALTAGGVIAKELRRSGVEVLELGFARGRVSIGGLSHLRRHIRSSQPHVVQTWMYHADLIGGLVARLAGARTVSWNLRHSNLQLNANRTSTLMVAFACARLSKSVPSAIVCGSEAARRAHAAIGYSAGKMVVIPNGFDLSTFSPNTATREASRAALGIPAASDVVGIVARAHPQKDYSTFLAAGWDYLRRNPTAHLVLCGRGVTAESAPFSQSPVLKEFPDRVHLLGERTNIKELLPAFDVFTLSSIGEGFPNALGEAMACGVPAVVTDVGDCADIVGDTGIVVPPRDAPSLAKGWETLTRLGAGPRDELGRKARARIQSKFSLAAVVKSYEQLYEALSEQSDLQSADRPVVR